MRLFRTGLAVMLALLGSLAIAADTKTVAVLDTELIIDNKPTPHSADRPGEKERAGYMAEHIARALDGSGYYEVVALQQARQTIEQQKNAQRYLHKCNSCIRKIGQELDVDYVATSWVQVVSNLIVNLNLVLYDAETGDAVRTSFIDIRGNNNSTWRNGTNYMLEKFFKEYHEQAPRQALEQAQSAWPDQRS